MRWISRLFIAIGLLPASSCRQSEHDANAIPSSVMPTDMLAAYERPNEDHIHVIEEAVTPWGDYGHILIHGMGSHLPLRDGVIQLERTGPFVPPITFPGEGIVVTDEMKKAMAKAGFRGVGFRGVHKTRIVHILWYTWDLDARNPPYYPDTGEPEDYLLGEQHSEELAEQIGDLWEVVLGHGASVEALPLEPDEWLPRLRYISRSWKGDDLFLVPENGYKYASPRARRWFEKHFPNWTAFRDLAE